MDPSTAFDDLIPKKPPVRDPSTAFNDLIPKKLLDAPPFENAASSFPTAPQIGEEIVDTLEPLGDIPAQVKAGYQEGQEHVRRGLEQMGRPGLPNMAVGAGRALLGEAATAANVVLPFVTAPLAVASRVFEKTGYWGHERVAPPETAPRPREALAPGEVPSEALPTKVTPGEAVPAKVTPATAFDDLIPAKVEPIAKAAETPPVVATATPATAFDDLIPAQGRPVAAPEAPALPTSPEGAPGPASDYPYKTIGEEMAAAHRKVGYNLGTLEPKPYVRVADRPGYVPTIERNRLRREAAAAAEAVPAKVTPGVSAQPVGAQSAAAGHVSAAGPEGAQAIIRQKIGLAERATQTEKARAEPLHVSVNKMNESQQLDLMDYVTGAKSTIEPKLKEAANSLRTGHKDVEFKLQNTEAGQKKDILHEFYKDQAATPKDAAKADQFLEDWGVNNPGKLPGVSDAVRAGVKLKTTNPLQAHLNFTEHMNRRIALNEALEEATKQGVVVRAVRGHQPEGHVELKGQPEGPNRVYAPPEFAKDWNHFVSQGFKKGGVVDTSRRVSNVMTGVKLFGGYHGVHELKEAFANDVSQGITALMKGKLGTSARSLGRASTVFGSSVQMIRSGHKFQKVYKGGAATAEDAHLASIMSESNFRPEQLDRSLNISHGGGNLITAWKRGALPGQMADLGRGIKDAPHVWKAVKAADAVFDTAGRLVETAVAPLLQVGIPKLKTGAWKEAMQNWIEAHPGADHNATVAQGRRISDTIENRFGEVNHDNIFWNKQLKEGLQAAYISYSWELGIFRAVGDAAKDTKKFATGKGEWTDRMSYVLAYPIAAMYANAVYQGYKTHTPPKSLHDLFSPLTGGRTPVERNAEGDITKRAEDERGMLPGYDKDFAQIYAMFQGDKGHDFLSLNEHKLVTALHLARAMITGYDWRDDPITDPGATVMYRMGQRLAYVGGETPPIGVGALDQRKKGTAISPFETIMGIKPAPSAMQNPTLSGINQRLLATNDYITKLRHDIKTATLTGKRDSQKVLENELADSVKQQNKIKFEKAHYRPPRTTLR